MALQELRVTNYRSLRDIHLPLGNLNVIIGPNGSGKSNLYRAIWLLAQISEGEFARAIAREGGLPSTLWCRSTPPSPRRDGPQFSTRWATVARMVKWLYRRHQTRGTLGTKPGGPLHVLPIPSENEYGIPS